ASPRIFALATPPVCNPLLRLLAGIAQDEQAPLVVVHVDVTARIDGKLLAPIDFGGMRAGLAGQAGPLRRHEIADLLRQTRIADIEYAQTCIEPGDVHQVAGLLDGRVVDLLAGVVRPEPAALVAKILVRRIRR